MTVVLAPLAGGRLSILRIPADPIAAAPLGAALTTDGVMIWWATAGSADKLAATFARQGTPWSSPDGRLWKIGETIAVLTDKRVAIVAAGAPSTRERTALAFAAGALRVDAPPTPAGLAIEVDAPTLFDLVLTDPPGDLLSQIATDLGRIKASLVAAPDRVTLEVQVSPTPNTLAERMIAGAHGLGAPIASGAVILSTSLSPDDASTVLQGVGQRAGLNISHMLGEKGAAILTGQVSLGPGGVGLRVTDPFAVTLHGSNAVTVAPNGLIFGGTRTGDTDGAGLNISIESVATLPLAAFEPPPLDPILDENTDVPWSPAYREARLAFDAQRDKLVAAVTARTNALNAAVYKWENAFGPALLVPFTRADTGFTGRGEWLPPKGSIAAAASAAAAELGDLDRHRTTISTTHAAAVAARATAIESRARDVAAWDRAH
jgi:hypothetical protein